MASATSEPARFKHAVDAALAAVDAGDQPQVAAGWAAEKHDLEHRLDELRQRVQEEVDDG